MIKDAFINAALADAAYVDELSKNPSGAFLANALSKSLTPEVAQFVSDNFTVVTTASNLSSSFEGVVWRGNAGTPYANQIFVSMRGTQSNADKLADLDLAFTGLPSKQLVDMVNWWLRETTPTTQAARQIALSGSAFTVAPAVQGTGTLASVTSIQPVTAHSVGRFVAGNLHDTDNPTSSQPGPGISLRDVTTHTTVFLCLPATQKQKVEFGDAGLNTHSSGRFGPWLDGKASSDQPARRFRWHKCASLSSTRKNIPRLTASTVLHSSRSVIGRSA